MTVAREAIQKFADELGVDYCTVQAVIDTETNGKAFLADGRPVILFEGHIFWKQLNAVAINPRDFVAGNEDILYQTWTKKYYRGGAGEYERLERAMAIDRKAALCSASWGLFQIMGFNFAQCGCKSVEEFVEKQKNIDEQLKLAAAFLKNAGHVPALKKKDWATFARRYNGAAYAENQYDVKLKNAYNKCELHRR